MRYQLTNLMGNVFNFLTNNSKIIKSNPHLRDVKKKMLDMNSNLLIPNNLDKFDLSSCFSILRGLTQEEPINGWWEEYSIGRNDNSLAANFNRLRLIRNVNFGHLVAFKLNDGDYDYYKNKLKQIIIDLCDNQNMKQDYATKIDSVLSSSYSDKEIFKKYREEIIDLMIEHKEDLIKEIKEIEELNIKNKIGN
ncbi:unnamed protein product [Didymodactylos carnosus]|uniref:DZIP3-like HEPN domain-containing protein n=1 Tax=Didymodactylos carnosus TaxID=1234261 RepID=A0A815WPM8_9BILA|nr:unnamed protein product [Didymodactylos carnosus]CAF4411460.1 unnamed protein product [Didymodactylos carnosus]